MTNWLIRHFVLTKEENRQRYSYGILAGVTGIVCNVFLFLLKLTAGVVMHSIAVLSDGFNNLSDAMSGLITVVGYKLSSKPADAEHPYGHGRMEYVVSFISVMLIYVVTYELLSESIRKVIHPEKLQFNLMMVIFLTASILVKVWLSYFDRKIGKLTDSVALLTAARDAGNDVLVTSLTVTAMLLAVWNENIPFDGIGGIVLSVYLLWSAIGLSRDIISRILGKPVDAELCEEIEKQITRYPEVLGVHDLMIHEYGPDVKYGSAHAEVDSHMELLKAHDVIDLAEREILKEHHIVMTIHLDPVVTDDPEVKRYRQKAADYMQELDPACSIHDFRMIPGQVHTNLIFDVLVPFSSGLSRQEITEYMQKRFEQTHDQVHLHITVDREYRKKGDAE